MNSRVRSAPLILDHYDPHAEMKSRAAIAIDRLASEGRAALEAQPAIDVGDKKTAHRNAIRRKWYNSKKGREYVKRTSAMKKLERLKKRLAQVQ